MNKIIKREQLLPILKTHRDSGKKVVMAGGCFDIIHPGHIRYLKEASEQADIFIVAVNSDSSVRKIKSPPSPINDEFKRMELLAEFDFVDHVFSFDETTTKKTLEILKPDFYAKGRDYNPDNLPKDEWKILDSYGGTLVCVGDKKQNSTSNIISSVRRSLLVDRSIKSIVVLIGHPGMGDLLFSFPLFKHLRYYYPEAKITAVIEIKPYNKGLCINNTLFDEIIEYSFSKKNIFKYISLIKRLKRRRFDIGFDLQRKGLHSLILNLSRVKKIFSFGFHGKLSTEEADDSKKRSEHNSRHHLRLIEAAGLEVFDEELFLPMELKKTDEIKTFIEKNRIKEYDKIIGINPSGTAGCNNRLWPLKNFTALVDLILENGISVILFGGVADNKNVDKVIEKSKYPDRIIKEPAGEFNLLETAWLMKRCNVFISGDTGLMHLAQASGTQVIALYGPTNPVLSGPVGRRHRVITSNLLCIPCSKRFCADNLCMKRIGVKTILNIALEILEND